jgi:hypothetical protein
MPYIVTTTPREPEGWDDDSDFAPSRRAVATLEEARRAARSTVERAMPIDRPGFSPRHGFLCNTDALPEEGGTIGSLPDGTVIEVERVSEAALYNAIRPTLCCPTCGIQQSHVSGSHLIDAYNAARGREVT